MATGTMMRSAEGTGTYSYSSEPHPVRQTAKYRDQEVKPANIMYDRRIVRGNTYAITTLPANTQKDATKLQQQQHSNRQTATTKRVRQHMRLFTPPPVSGRTHTDVQTELYLEEITDRVEEADVQTQTDAFLDRPPTPLFIPAKTGADAATQIEEGDLFDFDLEVIPILEVLVGKTVEQALLEVMEEEELAALREQQRVFEENRNAELVETQRLEEQERRRREEKERRMQQQRQAILKEKETSEKIAARAFAQSYLTDLVPAVFTTLSDSGFFYDRVEIDVQTNFLPWLMDETEKILDKNAVARLMLDDIIRNVVKKMLGIVTPPPASPEPEPTEPEPVDTSTAPVSDSEAKVAEPAPSETKPDEQQEPTSVTDEAKKSDDQELEEDTKKETGDQPQQPLPDNGEPPTEDEQSKEEPKPSAEGDEQSKEEPKPLGEDEGEQSKEDQKPSTDGDEPSKDVTEQDKEGTESSTAADPPPSQ